MKKVIFLIFVSTFIGCASIEIPNYIKNENPYKKTFYSDYSKVLPLVKETLSGMGWKVSGESRPSVYEVDTYSKTMEGEREVILFTKTHTFQFFLGTSYSKINVYVKGIDKNSTDVEVRYFKVTSILFKNFESYKKDKFAQKFFSAVEMKLAK